MSKILYFLWYVLCLNFGIWISTSEAAWAHGGEDHGAPPAVMASKEPLLSQVSVHGVLEVLVKYPAPVVGLEKNWRIFLTDVQTNEPLPQPELHLRFREAKTAQEWSVKAHADPTPGFYHVPVKFPVFGNYIVTLYWSKEVPERLIIPSLEVPASSQP